MTTPSFCVSPWHTVAVDTLGQFRVCCFSSWGKNNLLNENNEILKIYEQKLETISKSKTIQLIRKQMLEGKRPDMCSLCFKQEDSGVKSHRQFQNERWLNPLLNYAVQDPMRIKYIDLRLSNVCNLRCRMCNPYSSHLWVNE